jgi:threonine dehydrogenase-like Zn-dependent dehydrogenase
VPARALYFEGDGRVSVREQPVPEPAADELLVRTRVSAVSPGTELLLYRGQVPDGLALDESIDALDGGVEYPLRYGYAAVGEVSAAGSAVADDWLGRTVLAYNPHESHFTASPAAVEPVPGWCEPATATLAPNAETAVTVAMDARPMIGERAAVFGQGLVGLLATAALARFPLDALVGVDPLVDRRERARRLGVTDALDPTGARERFEPTGPGAEGRSTAGTDLTVELSGQPTALDDAVAVTGYDGRIVVGSWYGTKRVELDLGGRYHRSRIELRASQVSTVDPALRGRWDDDRRLGAAWEHLRAVETGPLLGPEMPIDEAPRAYRRLADEEPPVGTLFTYPE